MDNATASLSLMLKQLKLATMVKEWDALGNKAVKEQWSPQQYYRSSAISSWQTVKTNAYSGC